MPAPLRPVRLLRHAARACNVKWFIRFSLGVRFARATTARRRVFVTMQPRPQRTSVRHARAPTGKHECNTRALSHAVWEERIRKWFLYYHEYNQKENKLLCQKQLLRYYQNSKVLKFSAPPRNRCEEICIM